MKEYLLVQINRIKHFIQRIIVTSIFHQQTIYILRSERINQEAEDWKNKSFGAVSRSQAKIRSQSNNPPSFGLQ